MKTQVFGISEECSKIPTEFKLVKGQKHWFKGFIAGVY